MAHKELFQKKDVLIVQEKSLKQLVKEFILSKVAEQTPAALQKINSITVIFEEFFFKFPEDFFHRIHLSGCFLKLYSQHCLIEVLQDFDIHLDLLLLRQTLIVKIAKINYHVPITSATKLKKHKVRNELIQTFFKQYFRQAIGISKFLE